MGQREGVEHGYKIQWLLENRADWQDKDNPRVPITQLIRIDAVNM